MVGTPPQPSNFAVRGATTELFFAVPNRYLPLKVLQLFITGCLQLPVCLLVLRVPVELLAYLVRFQLRHTVVVLGEFGKRWGHRHGDVLPRWVKNSVVYSFPFFPLPLS